MRTSWFSPKPANLPGIERDKTHFSKRAITLAMSPSNTAVLSHLMNLSIAARLPKQTGQARIHTLQVSCSVVLHNEICCGELEMDFMVVERWQQARAWPTNGSSPWRSWHTLETFTGLWKVRLNAGSKVEHATSPLL